MHDLIEYDFWLLKFYDKIDPPLKMRIIYNTKRCYAIRLKFGDKFLTSLTKLLVKAKSSIYSAIKDSLHLYCGKFSPFVVVGIFNMFL